MKTMSYLFAVIFVSHFAMFITETSAEPISELVVFGDSGVDVGNYPGSRFSNGLIWIDELALQLDVPFTQASERGGLNFAWGGARTGSGIDVLGNGNISVPQLGRQIAMFLSENAPRGDQLLVVNIAYNDFGWVSERDPRVPLDRLSESINALIDAGAKNLLVPNVAPVGHAPFYRDGNFAATLDRIVPEYNQLLPEMLDSTARIRGVNISSFDVFGSAMEMVERPADFGLVDVTSGARLVGALNPDEYLYWDNYHYTEAAHRYLGERAAKAIPITLRENYLSLIEREEEWRHFAGTEEPSTFPELGWTQADFDDTSWNSGKEGFGFGRGQDLEDVATVLEDMRGTNTTHYIRHRFSVDEPDNLKSLKLHIDYDDAFVAYINGVEVARSDFDSAGTPVAFDANAQRSHAFGMRELFLVDLADLPGLITSGSDNVLAVQGINRKITDGDFILAQLRLDGILNTPHGDFNADGILDSSDIDSLTFEVIAETNLAKYDVDHDGIVGRKDHSIWVKEFRQTWFGDANLDGKFNSGDLVAVFEAGQYEDDVAMNSGWATGDWNGDADFNTSDLVVAFQDGGYEQGPIGAMGVVPEPASIMMLTTALIGIAVCRRILP